MEITLWILWWFIGSTHTLECLVMAMATDLRSSKMDDPFDADYHCWPLLVEDSHSDAETGSGCRPMLREMDQQPWWFYPHFGWTFHGPHVCCANSEKVGTPPPHSTERIQKSDLQQDSILFYTFPFHVSVFSRTGSPQKTPSGACRRGTASSKGSASESADGEACRQWPRSDTTAGPRWNWLILTWPNKKSDENILFLRVTRLYY